MRLLLALPLILAFAQDDAAIQDLIKRLDDNDPEVREKCSRELVAAGAKALEPLKRALSSESAEVRVRAAQAIRSIEHALKSREVYPEHKPLTLKRAGTVGEILDELARLTGAHLNAPPEHREAKASVDATTLLQALDQVCVGQERLTFTVSDDGKVQFSSERHIAPPASYCEAFKIFMAQVDVARKTDYKETTVSGRISIHTAWEGRLKPLKRVRYESLKAKDDAGRDIEVVAETIENMIAVGGGAGIVMAGWGEEGDLTGPQAFALKGLAPESKSLATVSGKVVTSFPLARVDVVFEDAAQGQKQTVGDIAIRLGKFETGKNLIALTFAKSKGDVTGLKDEILGRLEPGSVKAVDEDGKEHAGEISPFQDENSGVMVFGGPGGGESKPRPMKFQATFPTLEKKEIKRFKFRFSDAMFEKTVPFEIKNVKLP